MFAAMGDHAAARGAQTCRKRWPRKLSARSCRDPAAHDRSRRQQLPQGAGRVQSAGCAGRRAGVGIAPGMRRGATEPSCTNVDGVLRRGGPGDARRGGGQIVLLSSVLARSCPTPPRQARPRLRRWRSLAELHADRSTYGVADRADGHRRWRSGSASPAAATRCPRCWSSRGRRFARWSGIRACCRCADQRSSGWGSFRADGSHPAPHLRLRIGPPIVDHFRPNVKIATASAERGAR